MGFWGSLRDGTLAVTGTIYELGDTLALGALPNTLQGVRISNVGGTGTEDSLLTAAAADLAAAALAASQVAPNLTSGLPQTGTNLGLGVGNLGYYSLMGVGAGAGNAVGSIGSGLGSGLGDLGGGLGKGLLPIALIAAGLVLVLVLSTRGRNVNAGPVAVSGGAA